MSHRLLLALIVLVAAPLVLLGWVSTSTVRQQQQLAQQQVDRLIRNRLVEFDRSLGSVLDAHARRIVSSLEKEGDLFENLESLRRSDPVVRQVFFTNAKSVILYPPKPIADDAESISLYASIPAIISSRPERDTGDKESSGAAVSQSKLSNAKRSFSMQSLPTAKNPQSQQVATAVTRWQVWYMDEGSQLILWLLKNNGDSIGVLLERARWVADLTSALPDSDSRPQHHLSRESDDVDSGATISELASESGFTALVDEANRDVYLWGVAKDGQTEPRLSISLSEPLSSWKLQYHSEATLVPSGETWAMLLLIGAIGVVLLGLGVYVVSNVQRQMHAARSRVSFAGQVSHELRTPLTNIRLYAELAETDLEKIPGGDVRDSIRRRLGVIDTESRRLGRLVSGVLEMVREDSKMRAPALVQTDVDELIDQTISQFTPSFCNLQLQVDRQAAVGKQVPVDPDILEMVLVNLLSNVEKYAAKGKYVRVASRLDADDLVVEVSDLGPGIPRRYQQRIFKPFFRLDDSINAPSGTGIGLAIARRAANRHGGSLVLRNAARGTCFELRLPLRPIPTSRSDTPS